MKRLILAIFITTLLFLVFIPVVFAGAPVKEDTTVALMLGPFLDDVDGTPETGLTITETLIYISKNGGAFGTKNDTNDCSHASGGWYSCQFDATDTSTAGRMVVYVDLTGSDVTYVYNEFEVWTANSYDSIVAGSDNIQSDLTQIGGSAVSTVTAQLGVNVIEVESSDATDQILGSVVDDATQIDASALNALSGHDPGSTLAAQTDVSGLNDPTAAAIVDEWESQSQADPTGFRVNVIEVFSTTQTANDNGADINLILADTGELQTDWANGGRLDLILDARASQSTADAIETDTQDIQNRLPTTLVGGRIDASVGAITGTAVSTTTAQLGVNVIEVESVDATDQVADAVWDEVVESTLTAREVYRVLLSVMAGKSDGGGTATIHFRDYADGTNRVTATVDGNGNRTAITLDGSE